MFEGAIELIRERGINWYMTVYISLVHVLGIAGLFYIPYCKWQTLAWAFALWFLSGFGVCCICHRLYSHRSYKANLPYRVMGMLLNSIANQGSIVTWVFQHRCHHRASETEADPHNAKISIFYAHMGWLFLHRSKEYRELRSTINIDDLKADGPVMFQKRFDPWWNWCWCFLFPALFGNYFWGESIINGFFVPGCLRYLYVLHATWTVNGFSHSNFGKRRFSNLDYGPSGHIIGGIMSLGEGLNHDYHHLFPYDYNNTLESWYETYNPSSMFIDFFAMIGWVTDRKTARKAWALKEQKMEEEKLKNHIEKVKAM